MKNVDLYKHADSVNELLARYGVKFGIYKNGSFKEQLFPFDAIPRVITKDEFDYLERGLKQRILALNCFIKDIYDKKQIVKDNVVPEEFVYASSGYLSQCEGVMPPKGIYTHIAGIDLVQGKDGDWYILEDNLRVPSGASYPMIARDLCRKASPKTFESIAIEDNRNYAKILKATMDHVNTGGHNVKQFEMPYVILHEPRPFDTTTLNYNWQIWESKAFSVYTTSTSTVNKRSAKEAVGGILSFLSKQGLLNYHKFSGYNSAIVKGENLINLRTTEAGFFDAKVEVGDEVLKGQLLATVHDVYTNEILSELIAPVDGVVFFMHSDPMTYANTAVIKIIEDE